MAHRGKCKSGSDHLQIGGSSDRLAAVAGGAAPTLAALVEGEAGDYERGGRVRPPPATRGRSTSSDEVVDRLRDDVGDEEVVAGGDELLRAALCACGCAVVRAEEPDDDRSG